MDQTNVMVSAVEQASNSAENVRNDLSVSGASKASMVLQPFQNFFKNEDASSISKAKSKVTLSTMSGSIKTSTTAGGDTREPEGGTARQGKDEEVRTGAEEGAREPLNQTKMIPSMTDTSQDIKVQHDSLLKILANQTKDDTIQTNSTRQDSANTISTVDNSITESIDKDVENERPATPDSTNELSRDDSIEMVQIEVQLPPHLASKDGEEKKRSPRLKIPRGRHRSRSRSRSRRSMSKSKANPTNKTESQGMKSMIKSRQKNQDSSSKSLDKHSKKDASQAVQPKEQQKVVKAKIPSTPTGSRTSESRIRRKSPKNLGETSSKDTKGSQSKQKQSKFTKGRQNSGIRASPRNHQNDEQSKGPNLVGSVLQSLRRNGHETKIERGPKATKLKSKRKPEKKVQTTFRDHKGTNSRQITTKRVRKVPIHRGRSKSHGKKVLQPRVQSQQKNLAPRRKHVDGEKGASNGKRVIQGRVVKNKLYTDLAEVDDGASIIADKASNRKENQEDGSWLIALTESWATPWYRKVQPSVTMADLEDQRLGDNYLPPDRVVNTRRLEAGENIYQPKMTQFEPVDPDLLGSLTDSVSFALSTDHRVKTGGVNTDSASDWDEATPKKDAPRSRGRGDNWREIVEASDVLARHGFYERRGDYSLRKNAKVTSAHKTLRQHAARLNLKERDLYSALREDPSFFLSAASFESRSSLALLWDHVWKGTDQAIGSLYNNVMGYDRD